MSIMRSLHRRFPHPTQPHWWRIPFLIKGGFGTHGYWVSVLGFKLSVHDASWYGYAIETRLSFLCLVSITHQDSRGTMLKRCGPIWAFNHVRFDLKGAIRWAR